MTDPTHATLATLAADLAIRQLHARYIDAVWRKDEAAFTACFAPGAEWRIAGLHAVGREAIGEVFGRLIGPSVRVLMFAGMPCLQFSGATASGRVNITELVKRRDGESMRTLGVYYDRYRAAGEGEARDGEWLFTERHWHLFYRGPPDLSADMIDAPEYGPPPAMPPRMPPRML